MSLAAIRSSGASLVIWRLGLVAVMALAAVLIFARLADGGLRDGDEARYALVSENILQTGDLVTMHYQGQPYFKKCPTRFLLGALTFSFYGINPWTVRVWSGLAAMVAIWLTCLMARNLYGRYAGLLAGLALATSPGFLHVHGARTGEMDTALVMFLLLGLLPFTREPRKHDLFFMGVAMAGCGMAKHLVFVFISMMMIAVGLLATGRWRLLKRKDILMGALILGILLLPWTVAQIVLHGRLFWESFFGVVLGETIVKPPELSPGFGFYPGVVLSGMWPWLPVMLVSVLVCIKSRTKGFQKILPLLWGGLFLVIILAAKRKLPWYVLPAYPFVAMLVGAFAGHFMEKPRRWFLAFAPAFIMGLAVLAWLVGFHTAGFADRPGYRVVMDGKFLLSGLTGWRWMIPLATVVLGTILHLVCMPRNRGFARASWAMMGAGLIALTCFAIMNAWEPLNHPYQNVWHDTYDAIHQAGIAPDNVLVLAPLPKDRDDVQLYYRRRMSGSTRSNSLPQIMKEFSHRKFRGVVVAPKRTRYWLEKKFRERDPHITLEPIHEGQELSVLKIVQTGS